MNGIKLVAFDLDGTLTQHKEPLSAEHRDILDALRKKYRLLMVGAGQVRRIYNQMGQFPLDIIGNYGMQYAEYDAAAGDLHLIRDDHLPIDREAVEKRAAYIREKYGYTTFAGDSVEYHPSGCLTLALLGTKAVQADKLAFDPDRAKRRVLYDEVVELFPEYHVFIGGSSSFDMAPKPYNKFYALDLYCKQHGLTHDEVVFVGDDFAPGGNDHSVRASDFGFIEIDDYRNFPRHIKPLL